MSQYIAKPIAVTAYRILEVHPAQADGTIPISLEHGVSAIVTPSMTARLMPHVGDYYVIQTDGCRYLNPAEVFERKYSRFGAVKAYQNIVQRNVVRPEDAVRRALQELAIAGDVPGVEWTEIAASAYRAYAASTENGNFRGEPMLAFGELPESIQTAWEAAVRQAGAILHGGANVMCDAAEQSWTGWERP